MDASWKLATTALTIFALLPAHARAMGRSAAAAADRPSTSSLMGDADETALAVDKYNHDQQLTITRKPSSQSEPTDRCEKALSGHDRFGERIAFFVDQAMSARAETLRDIDPLYGVDASNPRLAKVGLMSHPLCHVTSQSLQTTLAGHHQPSSRTIAMANDFADRYNALRQKAVGGNSGARAELTQLWSRFMGCLGYVESLGDADSSRSDQVARKVAPQGYNRPPGVLFYIDDLQQSEASQLNIGLFQFSPVSGGNIGPCIQQWNSLYPSCKVPAGGSSAQMIHALGGAMQDFNAFCGVDKILQTFHVQANTVSASRTHPTNRVSGSFKAPQDRCVSLHFYKSLAYVHFGPFMNSTGSNLDELLSCALDR